MHGPKKIEKCRFSMKSFISIDVSGLRRYNTLREECNGMDGRGFPVPKSDDSLVSLSIGTLWHTTSMTPSL
jgi:hypothetical protein